MKTYTVLLVIGTLGILSSIYGAFTQLDLTTNLLGFICGASLIFGYFEIKKTQNKNFSKK
jgi:hypothetical protein